ncbi:MAG: M23 family metallopeptidase [Bacteroidales bacterium]
MKYISSVIVLFILSVLGVVHAQNINIALPLKLPLAITGNFGELRNNHFHTGLDMRAPLNTPVYAPDLGYVSRISVSSGGYGNALYITHPSGIITVYGHINSFAPFIAKELKKRQYELEYYAVDLTFTPGQFPVKRGDLVAYTGNRGSSGGPHLHFEVRDAQGEKALDPLKYYKHHLKDTRPPAMRTVAVIPLHGYVNGREKKVGFTVVTGKKGKKALSVPITAWGEIIMGVKANDYVDGMSNIYGIYSIKLFQDDNLIYESEVDTLDFSKGRMLNTYVDYQSWEINRSFIMRSYVASGNTLPFYGKVVNRGVVNINEERNYRFRYELRDIYGNVDVCEFTIKGVEKELPKKDKQEVSYDRPYLVKKPDFSFDIPAYTVYEDWAPVYSSSEISTPGYYSSLHKILPQYVPFDKSCIVKIKVNNDTLQNKSQYYIGHLSSVSSCYKRDKVLNSVYADGWLSAETKTPGSFVVMSDTTSPMVRSLGVSGGELKFVVTDYDSGIKYFKGEIDGKFVLFQLDCKDNIARYSIDHNLFKRGIKHRVKFTALDNCGNQRIYDSVMLF